jgi:hypothetical protein
MNAFNSYMDSHLVSPLDLQKLSRHYRASVEVIRHSAEKNTCPPEVLETLLENALNLQKDPAFPRSKRTRLCVLLHCVESCERVDSNTAKY